MSVKYRVEYEDSDHYVKKRNSIFREYQDAVDYFTEKFSDTRGRYTNIRLLRHEIVETETVLLESEE